MRKIILICLLFLSACASTVQSHLDTIQNNFSNGDFEITKDKNINDENNLDLLIDAIALFHKNEFKESDAVFEEFNKRNLKETSSSISRETAGLLFGAGVNSYKPYMMDSLFVSYYQIWDLLAMHDWANVRVVINQSYERQKKMSIEYQDLIKNNKQKLSEIPSELNNMINKNQYDWDAFTDIMNPALMYLSGIYFLNDGDFANAETYLKRANGMMPNNSFIKSDLEFAQKKQTPQNTTWIFYESGFAPRLREENSSLFLPMVGLVQFTISEPYFNSAPQQPHASQILADVDKMFLTEYNEYRTNEILRAYASAVSKSALQATMYNSHSDSAPLLGILSTIYTISSSNADVRTWATLPKYIYVQRIDTDKTNLNELNMGGKINSDLNGNNLIYVRMHDKPTDVKIIKLK